VILSIDPGAIRCGYAVLSDKPDLILSGIVETPRFNKEPYQAYRLRVEERIVTHFRPLLLVYKPTALVTETVPPRGNKVMTQLYLANCVCSVLHTLAFLSGIDVYQQSASTMANRMAIVKRRDVTGRKKPPTKIDIRNGVYRFFPELAADNPKADETDAIGHGLVFLGHRNK
jgi:Holliday junction resolvasome RuvABC endonuclease subunit